MPHIQEKNASPSNVKKTRKNNCTQNIHHTKIVFFLFLDDLKNGTSKRMHDC
jgi:hypothetical protein